MTTTQALRHLVKVLHAMDHPDEQKRPTEAAYQLALATADAALAFADFGDSATAPLELCDGSAIDLRTPWKLPNLAQA